MLAPTEAAMLGYLNILKSNSRKTTRRPLLQRKTGGDEGGEPQVAHTSKTPLVISPEHHHTSFPRRPETEGAANSAIETLSLAGCDTVIKTWNMTTAGGTETDIAKFLENHCAINKQVRRVDP